MITSAICSDAIYRLNQAATDWSDQRKGSPERQMQCKITASFLASATRALPVPDRLAIARAQLLKLDAFFILDRITPAASYSNVRVSRHRISISDRYDPFLRLILSRRKPQVRADRSRFGKSGRIFYRADICKGRQYADAGTLISSRHVALSFIRTRMALSKEATCSRSCRQATSIGRTIGATSERPSTRASTFRSKGKPRTAPGSNPKVFNTPRMWCLA